MRRMELIAPCHFGLEAVLKREIMDLGYEISEVEDGRVIFIGDEEAICRANVFLRTAERILIKVGSFKATSFEELFEATKSLRWEEYIPRNGKFWVAKAASIKSKLFSPSDIQSIMKKAMVRRLQEYYGIEWFPEDGASYPVRVFLMKDIVTIGIDTSGVSLHKRGYREVSGKAPITETLAASLIMLTPWNKDRILVDPFCGSGTFPIEAALIAANIAPGMNREFTAENWDNLIEKKLWYDAINEANDMINDDIEVDIQGYDIDGEVVEFADLPIAIDANQGWKDKHYALDMIHWLKEKGIVMIEQPMPKEQLDDIAWVTGQSPLPVFADESIQRLKDIVGLKDAFTGINIKLMKCTGMREAWKMVTLARALGMKVMVGCMTETSCAISAAAQFSPAVDFADLDGSLLIANDRFKGMEVVKGKITLPDLPGIGVVKI